MSDGNFDLVIVGAGASGGYTLKHLLQKLMDTDSHVRIAVVEQHHDFYKGVAYGLRSGKDALTITKLADFLPREELSRYLSWCKHSSEVELSLPVNKELQTLQLGKQIDETLIQADLTAFEALCTSRRNYGEYLAESILACCEQAAIGGRVTVETFEGEVVGIQADPQSGFVCDLVLEDGARKVRAKEVVVAIGSGTLRKIPFHKSTLNEAAGGSAPSENNVEYFEPYETNFDEAMQSIFSSCSTGKAQGPSKLLLIGANASALEVVFYCWMKWVRGELDFTIDMVSILGELPEIQLSVSTDSAIESMLLDDNSLTKLTASELHSISETLLKEGKSRKLPLFAYSGAINGQIFRALGLMSHSEAVTFLREYAVSLGRYQRKAESLYRNAADQLIEAGVMRVLAGAVQRVGSTIENSRISVLHTDGERSKTEYDYVVNCMGFEPIDSSINSSLISSLLKEGMVESSNGQAGFMVDNDFKTESGLHIMGPLLSGNFVQDNPVWHMEHVGRIFEFSKHLAAVLAKRLVNR